MIYSKGCKKTTFFLLLFGYNTFKRISYYGIDSYFSFIFPLLNVIYHYSNDIKASVEQINQIGYTIGQECAYACPLFITKNNYGEIYEKRQTIRMC